MTPIHIKLSILSMLLETEKLPTNVLELAKEMYEWTMENENTNQPVNLRPVN